MLVALPDLAFAQLIGNLKSNQLTLLSNSCKSLHNDLKDLLRDVRAVATISKFWKLHGSFMTNHHVIARFKEAKFTDHQLRPLEFMSVVEHLSNKSVIFCAKQLFTRLVKTSVALCPELNELFRANPPPDLLRVRVLLAAYMITYFSANIFEQIEAREIALIAEAKLLLDLVESFIKHYEEHSSFVQFPRANCLVLIPQIVRYNQAFLAWREPDTARLTTRINTALTALFIAKRNLPSETPVDDPDLLEIERQTTRLLGKLYEIGGPAAVDTFYDILVDQYEQGESTDHDLAHDAV